MRLVSHAAMTVVATVVTCVRWSIVVVMAIHFQSKEYLQEMVGNVLPSTFVH